MYAAQTLNAEAAKLTPKNIVTAATVETTAFFGVLWAGLLSQVQKGDQPLLRIRFRSFVRYGQESDAAPPC